MAVAGALGDSTVSLGNGCSCCAVDVGELDQYLERLARSTAGIDVIVIEASGLAEPQELVRMVLASEQPGIVYGSLVEVVDAAEFDDTRVKHPEVDRHLALADLVVVNKLDRAPDADRVLGLVRSLVDRAAVVPATYGRVDAEFLFDCRPSEERIGQLSFDDLADHDGHGEHDDHSAHLHAAYDSLSFTGELPMDPRRLMEFLDSRPEGLYRIKGYVDFGAYDVRNRYAVHAVGRFLRFYPEPWAPGDARLTQLVLIGSGIDASALRKELEGAGTMPHTPPTRPECGASCASYRIRRRTPTRISWSRRSRPGRPPPPPSSPGTRPSRRGAGRCPGGRQGCRSSAPPWPELRPSRPGTDSPRPSGTAGSGRRRWRGPCAGTGRTGSAWPSSGPSRRACRASPRP